MRNFVKDLLKNKKKLAIVLSSVAAVLLLAAVIFTVVKCTGKNSGNDIPVELLGDYYSMSGTTENTLKINENGEFTFVYERQTMSGNVTLEDSTLVFAADGDRIATGTTEQNAINLQYGGIAVKMLKKINFSLIFESNGGSGVKAQAVTNGKAPVLPTAPVRSGHKFVAWYADEGCTTVFDFTEPMTSNKTVYALWSRTEYGAEFKVSFDLNYDGAPTLDPIETIGNRIFGLQTPVREGYIFKGWYISQYNTAEKLSYICNEATTIIGEDTTLYAFWQAEDAKLQAPAITVSGSNVTWNRIEGGGVTYKVTIKAPSGEYIKKEEPTSNPLITGVIVGGGDYEITVTAIRGENSSSATIYYRIDPLKSVGGFRVEGKILYFNSVPNAKKYLITAICADSGHRVENLEITASQYDFSDCAIGSEGIKISVTAIADGYADSLASETVVRQEDLGSATHVITLNKGDYGELSEMTGTVSQGFRFVLPVPKADPASEYQFAGWYADASYTTPLTNTSGMSPGVWKGDSDAQAYALWVNNIFSYNLITVGGTQSYEIAAGKNFNRLTSVTIPSVYKDKPVARIQANGFANKTLISEINIPDTVVEIGDGAFKGCNVLTDLNVYDAGNSADVYTSIDGVLFAINKYTGNISLFKMPEGRTGRYTIPDGVAEILGKAFEGSDITDVTISEGIVNIGVEAFINSELKNISFSFGTEPLTISDRAFMNTKLTKIHLPARLTSIELKKLEICDVISGWSTITEPVTDISKATDAFYGCTELKIITVDSGSQTYKAIDNILFTKDATVLLYAPYTLGGEYSVPVNTQEIADGAFYGTAITRLTIANTVTEIGEGAFFASTTLTTVTFSENASIGGITIGRYAFGTTSTIKNALTQFIVNDNTKIKTICDYAFYYSQSLKEIHISQFTTSIGEKAFAFCRGAVSVDFSVGNEIRESELVIGENAFQNVPVASITLGASLKKFPTAAFSDMSKLSEIKVADGHESLISLDGVLYTKVDGKAHTLIVFPDGKGGDFVIPDGVVEISDNAFSFKKSLRSITIPASITKIGYQAFRQGAWWETALTEIVFSGTPLPGAELIIGDEAFYNLGLVASIALPAHTKSIGRNVFYQLGDRIDGVPSITLNEGLEYIGESAFESTKITSVIIPSTVRSIGSSAFANLSTLTSVSFAPDSHLVEIGERAFYGCPIESIEIPASVEVIGQLAFGSGISFAYDENGSVIINYGSANGVRAVTFESGSKLKTISAFAFAGSRISSIVIPKSVTFIGAYAFASPSSSLKSVVFEDGGAEMLKLGTELTVMVPVGEGNMTENKEYAFSGYVFYGARLTTLELPTSREADIDENAFENCELPKNE